MKVTRIHNYFPKVHLRKFIYENSFFPKVHLPREAAAGATVAAAATGTERGREARGSPRLLTGRGKTSGGVFPAVLVVTYRNFFSWDHSKFDMAIFTFKYIEHGK